MTQTAITAHLVVSNGDDAIAFYERAFGAKLTALHRAHDGRRVLHAHLDLLGGHIMLHDAFPEFGPDVEPPSPSRLASVALHVTLPEPAAVDRVMAEAASEGATVTSPAADMFWGDRYGRLRDPHGHVWSFGAALPGKAAT